MRFGSSQMIFMLIILSLQNNRKSIAKQPIFAPDSLHAKTKHDHAWRRRTINAKTTASADVTVYIVNALR